MTTTKIEAGDYVEFSEDGWNTIYKGKVSEVLMNSVYVKSTKYGNVYVPKSNVKIISKYDNNNH